MSIVDEIREEHGRRLRKPYGPRATTKITMTTLRSPGLAGGAIGPDMKMTHLLKWGGQIGRGNKTTLPSYGCWPCHQKRHEENPHLLKMGNDFGHRGIRR